MENIILFFAMPRCLLEHVSFPTTICEFKFSSDTFPIRRLTVTQNLIAFNKVRADFLHSVFLLLPKRYPHLLHPADHSEASGEILIGLRVILSCLPEINSRVGTGPNWVQIHEEVYSGSIFNVYQITPKSSLCLLRSFPCFEHFYFHFPWSLVLLAWKPTLN